MNPVNPRLRGGPGPNPNPDRQGGVKISPEQISESLVTALLEGIKSLGDIADSLEMISLYFERKGAAEELFSEEDFEKDQPEDHQREDSPDPYPDRQGGDAPPEPSVA